jgi:transcriptional regulator with XRE-family HTH domain
MSQLQHYRRQRGLSLRGLAHLASINYSRLHHAEHGRELTAAEYDRLATALGCPREELAARSLVHESTRPGHVHA